MRQRMRPLSSVGPAGAVVLLTVMLLFISGCGLFKKNEPDLPYVPLPDPTMLPAPSGGNTLSINGEPITVAEIVDAARTLIRPGGPVPEYTQFETVMKPRLARLVNSRVAEIVVYQEAMKGFDSSFEDRLDQAVETEVQRYVARFGGDYAAADRNLAERKLTWKAFRNLQKRQIMTQVFMQKEMGDPKPITHNDLVTFYDTIKDEVYKVPGVLQFRLIDIQPDAIELSDPNQNRLDAAAALAVEVAIRARAGYNFEALAKRYSNDHRREFGGLWNPVEPGSLALPYGVIEQAVMDMEPNDVAGPLPSADHFFIVKLEKKQLRGYKPFEEVQQDVHRRLEQDRLEKTYDAVMLKRLDMTKVGDIDSFVSACVRATYEDMRTSGSGK